MPKPREITGYNMRPNPWKPFKDKCVLECPSGYLEVEVEINGQRKLRCVPCRGICKKECPGIKVDSIASAQKMRGCTLIKGSLEIQIRGGSSAVKELDDNLNMIEEITGYLKVVRSFAIISLNFLKNLKIIRGETLESSKYALVILDNQNLMELWDWEKRDNNFQIKNGRLFFHFNPKLCLSKIDRLREIANLPDYTPSEVASNSNGDKVACDVKVLNVTVSKTESESTILVWQQFEHYDPRTLLGYVAHYIKAPFQNVTMYDGRDACGGDGWMALDISSEGRYGSSETVLLSQLKPYTQYAYYVSTYTVASEKTGAISPIKYFRTKASVPSSPRRLFAYSNSSSELIITWKPPLEPNGNVTYYNVSARWEKDSEDFIEQRNYCLEPITLPDTSGATHISKKDPFPQKDSEQDIWQLNTWTNPNCSQKIADKRQREKEIHLEDSLHNFIYIKRKDTVREKRSLVEGDLDKMAVKDTDSNAPADGKLEYYTEVVHGVSLVLRNLRHFALYIITVRACREYEDDEDPRRANRCSQPALVTTRTQSLPSADNVDNQFPIWEISNQSAGAVQLKWNEPEHPNSLIVTYQIEYRRTDIPNFKPTVECITRKHFQMAGNTHLLSNLHPGNYSLRLRALSLAGVGEYTSFKFFSIEQTSSISDYQLYGMILTFTSVVSLICIFALYIKRQNRIPSRKLIASVNPEYVPTVYEPDDWEVARTRVELIKEIGQGSFGMVYEGLLKSTDGGADRPCAIKTVNVQAADRDRIEFLNEASVMKAFNTHHVVKLLGVVSQGQPTLVIMELMGRGDLKSYLRYHRPDGENPPISPPSQKRILRMAVEIADGMAYLAAKKFVHRDLAARNCMVAEDLTVKIGDFGMTRDIYETEYYRKGSKGLLPVRWMAPESLKDGVFTSFSDAWSYGVVLYEMVTLASQPYQGLTNDQVLRYVIDGGIMSRPEKCPDKLYTVMRLCWDTKPTSRPTFLELIEFLETDVDPSFSAVSFYHSPEGREARSAAQPLSSCAIASELTPLTVSRDADDFSLSDEEDDYKEPSTSSKFSNGSTAPNGYAMSHTHHRNAHHNRELNTTRC